MRSITGNKYRGCKVLDKETGIVYPSIRAADRAILGYKTSKFNVLTRYPERFCRWYPYMEEADGNDS